MCVYVCVFDTYVHMHASIYQGQKIMLDLLELPNVDGENPTPILCKMSHNS